MIKKDYKMQIRYDGHTEAQLDYLVKSLKLSKSEIIRLAIEQLHSKEVYKYICSNFD